jgi:hypothetical protein
MSKETAVDWLVHELRTRYHSGALDSITISEFKMHAKALEKEQMLNAFITAHEYEHGDDARGYFTKDFIKYYNETYK